jgi:hypothetical protein
MSTDIKLPPHWLDAAPECRREVTEYAEEFAREAVRINEGEWKRVAIDALGCRNIYRAEHDIDPVKAVSDLLAWETEIALDPQVSSAAQKLIDHGKEEAARMNQAAAPQPAPADAAAICERIGDRAWAFYKGRDENQPQGTAGNPYHQGYADGADACAQAIKDAASQPAQAELIRKSPPFDVVAGDVFGALAHDALTEKARTEPRPLATVQKEVAELQALGWQPFLCPVCGTEGAAAAPQPAQAKPRERVLMSRVNGRWIECHNDTRNADAHYAWFEKVGDA